MKKSKIILWIGIIGNLLLGIYYQLFIDLNTALSWYTLSGLGGLGYLVSLNDGNKEIIALINNKFESNDYGEAYISGKNDVLKELKEELTK